MYSVTETVAMFEAKLEWEAAEVNDATQVDDSMKRKYGDFADTDSANKKIKMEIKQEAKVKEETKYGDCKTVITFKTG